jgi:serine/threonine-protein kinase
LTVTGCFPTITLGSQNMSFEIGKTYGNYEIIDVLNSSRDGITYKVKNKLVNRMEAMKVLPGNAYNDLEAVERFMREVRVHAGMQHSNIVLFYNAAELDGRLVMTSELAEGVTLAARLEVGPMPWKDAVSCMTQVLSALAYAHEHNIVHRDLIPARIVLTPEGLARINGFSLAKGLSEAHLTVIGSVVGSPKYISPEQVRGIEQVDARSDIYSAGIVLYEVLTGKPPFQAKSQFELMAAHVNAQPASPSSIRPEIPKELDAIVLKAMAKDPAARYQTAAEFRKSLEGLGTESPQPAQIVAAAAAPAAPQPVEVAAAAATEPPPPPSAAAGAPAVLGAPPIPESAPSETQAPPPAVIPEPAPPLPALPIPLSAPVFAPPSAAPVPRELMLAGVFLFLVGIAAFFAFR